MAKRKCMRCGKEFECTGQTFEAIHMAESGKHCWEVGTCECVNCACSFVYHDYYELEDKQRIYVPLIVKCFGKKAVDEAMKEYIAHKTIEEL